MGGGEGGSGNPLGRDERGGAFYSHGGRRIPMAVLCGVRVLGSWGAYQWG